MISIPVFLTTAPRHLFFTGKGGVGKTSLACASAVLLADEGRRVLLVSTDPVSNLDAVLGTELANSPTPVAGVPNLQAMNIDPEQAGGTEAYCRLKSSSCSKKGYREPVSSKLHRLTSLPCF
jgi:CO dehydrogenase nickel-insertion accessory protein CooC1